MKNEDRIVIVDFGGQYAHLIASRLRREKVFAEIIHSEDATVEYLNNNFVRGIILSGGPQSVYDENSPQCNAKIFELKKPALGICYGHQFMNHSLGGKVVSGSKGGKNQNAKIKNQNNNAKCKNINNLIDSKSPFSPPDAVSREYGKGAAEFGRAELEHDELCPLFKNIPQKSVFWMSHGDHVEKLGDGFVGCASTDSCPNAAVWNRTKNLFGIQFHPEVTHSQYGQTLLRNFLEICSPEKNWTMEYFLSQKKEELREKVGDKRILIFVSGGVDSTVAFAFLSRIFGPDRVQGLFIDTGLLRLNERENVERSLRNIGVNLSVIDASKQFFGNLKGITDPEKKREIIGNTFLEIQRNFFAHHQLENNTILAQGTIYPDTIETGATKNSAKIKTHHNRVPEIQRMIDEGRVIEPLAELYKDEVRTFGELLGLPHEMVWRHPFPGPGLGVRILCSDLKIKNAKIKIQNFRIFSYSTLPIKSVGVQGDGRTYLHPAVIWETDFDIDHWQTVATDLINNSAEINRVLVPLAVRNAKKIIIGKHIFLTHAVDVIKADVNPDRAAMLQQADNVMMTELEKNNLTEKIWQCPVVLAPFSLDSNGEESVILRPVDSIDAMSASVGKLPKKLLETVAEKILRDTKISAVFLDITSKPPGTIEWE